MPEPIAELIVQEVKSTLAGITTADGFNFTARVEREEGEGTVIVDGRVVVQTGDPIWQDNSPLGLDEYILPIGVTCYANTPASSTQDRATKLVRMAADVRKKLMADRHRLSRACNTEFPEKDDFNAADSPASVQVIVHVRFRTLRDNPYER
jgi:hypothetical protein